MRKVDKLMRSITIHLEQFLKDIIKDLALDDVYSYRMSLQNDCLYVYLYNMETYITVGKWWSYKDIGDMCMNKKIEYEFNRCIRGMAIKGKDAYSDKPEIVNGQMVINMQDVQWFN